MGSCVTGPNAYMIPNVNASRLASIELLYMNDYGIVGSNNKFG